MILLVLAEAAEKSIQPVPLRHERPYRTLITALRGYPIAVHFKHFVILRPSALARAAAIGEFPLQGEAQ
jgi:hypothetical protein